jgi:putative addiction module component (TIGR02574 family)
MSALTNNPIFDAALSLPPKQREELLVLLLHSLEPSDQIPSDEDLAEIHRRAAAIERGESTTISAEEVFAKYGIIDPL